MASEEYQLRFRLSHLKGEKKYLQERAQQGKSALADFYREARNIDKSIKGQEAYLDTLDTQIDDTALEIQQIEASLALIRQGIQEEQHAEEEVPSGSGGEEE